MRARLIRLSPIAVIVMIPLVLKSLRDRAVARHRANTPWYNDDVH